MGPIRSLIRNLLGNRAERLGERRGFLRELINPFSGPTLEHQHVFRSLGAGSIRKDIPSSKLALPPERQMQDRPDGPDTGPDARRRPYDGDGNPQVIQGGVQDLPAPPTNRRGELESRHADLTRRMSGLTDQMMTATPEELPGLQNSMVGASHMLGYASDELARMTQEEQASPAYKMGQLDDMARGILEKGVGSWPMYTQIGRDQLAIDTGKEVMPADQEVVRSAAKPLIHAFANKVFQEHNGAGPPEVRSRLINALKFVHSPPSVDAAGQPVVLDRQRSRLERDRIMLELNTAFNQTNDPDAAGYFKAMADAVVIEMGGVLSD